MQLIIKGSYFGAANKFQKSNHTSMQATIEAFKQSRKQTYTQANKVQAMEYKCEAISLILENIPSATTKSYEIRNAYGGF